MTIGDDDLVTRAQGARARAHAPYSRYRVGAAVVADGEVFDAANVENASFGASICAERLAIARAVLEGAQAIETIAVVTQSSPPAAPCGICLQTIMEFAPDPARVRILMANPEGERLATTLAELLPRGFRGSALE
jgi:cytidine deaminase